MAIFLQNNVNEKFGIIHILFAFTAFLEFAPYFIWHENWNIYYSFIIITTLVFFILLFSKKIILNKTGLQLAFIMMCIIFFYYYTGDEGTLRTFFRSIPLYLFIMLSVDDKRKVFKVFTYIFAISIIPGLLIYLMHQLGLDPGWSYLRALNPLKAESGTYYRQYFGAVKIFYPFSSELSGLYRFQGMFDEPGVLGTIAVLLLSGDNYKIKNNLKNIIILTGGILSFSFAFYVLSFVYFSIRKNYKFLIIVLILYLLIAALNLNLTDNSFLDRYLFSRSEAFFSGNVFEQRMTQHARAVFHDFIRYSDFSTLLFGHGAGAARGDPLMRASSTVLLSIYNRGILGLSLLVLFPLIYTLLINKTKTGFILLIIFFLSIYQRPNVLNLAYMTVFLGGLANLKYHWDYTKKTNSQED